MINDDNNQSGFIGIRKNRKKLIFNILYGTWTFVRSILVLIASCLLILSIIYFAGDYAIRHYWLPPSQDDHTPIAVEIKSGSSISQITELLESQDIVSNASVFKYYIDFSGYGSKMRAGSYVFNRTMSMNDIMKKLASGSGEAKIANFLIIEGSSVPTTASKLLTDKAISDKDAFLELCEDGNEFMSYSFIGVLSQEEIMSRKYILEGYLFPAKYEIYVNSSMDTIIKKMLKKFGDVFNDEKIARAEELGLSIDDVITLASVIEKEARPDDFKKVSAVFYNRLVKSMPLQSCATVQYIIGTNKIKLSNEDISNDSPYNTYLYAGLPAGPICSPSEKAIDAALYPDQEFMDAGYYFFATKDPESGELAFSKTVEEHAQVQALYEPLWIAYDKANGN